METEIEVIEKGANGRKLRRYKGILTGFGRFEELNPNTSFCGMESYHEVRFKDDVFFYASEIGNFSNELKEGIEKTVTIDAWSDIYSIHEIVGVNFDSTPDDIPNTSKGLLSRMRSLINL